MKLGFMSKEKPVGIVIITGSCCIPGMAPLDERTHQVVEQAISNTGVNAQVKTLPVTTAYIGGAPKDVIAQLVGKYNQSGQIGLPAILINGKTVSFGVPEIEQIETALLQAVNITKEKTNG
ncbi:MAG: hypothetical protein FD147_566 [Chloroflexi bacterium]|nr:MAG: hypothetical protein FD147_566 [Chloroflexota bacterium]MBA4376822.1 hypothetical protein [Anaerolinea sp.]